MKVAVGAPVAERGWILREWRRCLLNQTFCPSVFCFVYSDSEDDTLEILGEDWNVPVHIHQTELPFYSRAERRDNPQDLHRANHLSALRNDLLAQFLRTDADYFFSLDTDLLLEDPQIIEQLVETIQRGWDLAVPTTYLHPLGPRSECYNVGFWWGGEPGGYTEGWRRAEPQDIDGPLVPVDTPFAAVMMRRIVAERCKYRAHELGEDIGFGQSLREQGFVSGWRTDLLVRHVWGKSFLREDSEWRTVEAAEPS